MRLAGDDEAMTGEEVRAGRDELDLTQAELANLMGVSETTIRNWEHARHAPRNATRRLRALFADGAAPARLRDFPDPVLLRELLRRAQAREFAARDIFETDN